MSGGQCALGLLHLQRDLCPSRCRMSPACSHLHPCTTYCAPHVLVRRDNNNIAIRYEKVPDSISSRFFNGPARPLSSLCSLREHRLRPLGGHRLIVANGTQYARAFLFPSFRGHGRKIFSGRPLCKAMSPLEPKVFASVAAPCTSTPFKLENARVWRKACFMITSK